ncbi:MAG TPA: MBL fold metallo-hydrolase [Gemmatimonadaceae bacterium]|nr:MBL fold metallo-hydrolase [Gemmatimonadaceae bacterium]
MQDTSTPTLDAEPTKAERTKPVPFPPILPAHAQVTTQGEIEERPADYLGPNLDPAGLRLIPKQFGNGVYALLASEIPKDNGGVVIGARAALVVDAGMNIEMGRQIQAVIRQLTAAPLRYVVNTTYHGDHTFGNASFPADVSIVSSRLNRASMRDLEREKRIRSRNLRGNLAAIEQVVDWRKPDITFEHFMELDLGGRVVQLWAFGQGNGPGDVVVYEPLTRTAWTGNFLGHAGVAPMLLEGGPRQYIESLERMRASLDVRTIVPGHGPMAQGAETIDWMIEYLQALDREVRAGMSRRLTLEQILARRQAPTAEQLPPQARQHLGDLNRNMDRLNVLATYREIERTQ